MVDTIFDSAPQPSAPMAPLAAVNLQNETQPEHDPAELAAVTERLAWVEYAEAYWKDTFKQMKDNEDFAAKGAGKKWTKDGLFRVPILNRHINQAVARLYARNPTTIYKRRKKLMFQQWDGRQDTLQAAMQSASMGDPRSMALIQEVAAVVQQNLLIERMGKTLEVVWDYFLNEQSSNYKKQLKSVVRRAKVDGIAYVKLVFQRQLKQNPEISARIEDTTAKLKEIQRLLELQETDKLDENSAELFKLQTMLADLQQQEYIVVREGPVLDFPKADAVLLDPDTTIASSLTGCNILAFVYEKTKEEIKKLWDVELGDQFTDWVESSTERKPPISAKAGAEKNRAKKVKVYEIWDKTTQQRMTIIRGYPVFAEKPAAPDPQTSRFWPLFPLVFNEVEHDKHVIPPSDVEQGKPIQEEYNRIREQLRQHRIAARPYYVENGNLSDLDKKKLSNHLDHEVVSIQGLKVGQKVDDVIQRGPTAPIDPNLYEVEMIYKDLLRTVGTSEANLGTATGDTTATAASIAENSTSTQSDDNVDDIDELLSDLSVAASEMLLLTLSKETVTEIAGPGAVWPEMPQTRTEVSKHLYLEAEAGSSGRPNAAAELAKIERAVPMLVQLSGINPAPIARRYAELLDFDVEEFVSEGMPSITAINAMLSKAGAPGQATGDPQTSPEQQGPAGAGNAPTGPQEEPGGQPAYPSPAVGMANLQA